MYVNQGYVTWCEQCLWNVASNQKIKPQNFFEAASLKLGERFGKKQFESMAQAAELKPALTPTRIGALLIAGFVHACTLLLFILGVAIFFASWFTVVTIFGLIMAVMAWVLRPKISRVPTENVAGRDDFAALYGLADRVSQALGARNVAMIVVDDRFNAAFSRAGLRRRDVLYIGIPLFEILEAQERVALLAHEIAHGANGDPTRSFLVGTALSSLNEWYRMLHPPRLVDSRGGRTSFASFFANVVMLALSQIPRLWLQCLALMMFRDQQRAEYLADHLAAEAAGTETVLGVLRKLHMYDTVEMTVRRFYLNSSRGSIIDAMKSQVFNMPPRELERLDRMERMSGSRLDATHPPTPYRLDLLNAHSLREPRVVLTETDNAALDVELHRLEPAAQARLLNSLDSSSYY
jgi:heat shock protein HtpX